ncbi:hypothetical protein CcaverHIS002_0407550 [Cutaneotrichosporon cavernicola]|uniref:CRA domain-containing protein n=1 Tax=Cutaneotrichosporon cavernicola TaxID=279322 RepID=A0AA48QW10_9TREE|nr:uncharacterized protein CcaverHIS019_0407540 [Cutaneotrichosporon cavernicola]BEI84151.1 hypothetical protein CcaverHIS002_0407550 [Cutaneotrichosporon cavernicola]BEI91934.1 hypothetical protein CcaverHIS019_0407540 [Cutaneotrichosporon cavernicola]BEI99705.1 hypothetical protein CcaverHIS631_0407480 [Cutaneotrichosporon cavernicola]
MDKARASTLHDIVVDYVINNAYAGTASVLSRTPVPGSPSSSPTPQEAPSAPAPSLMEQLAERSKRAEAMDVDETPETLSPTVLERLARRREIIEYILSGSIAPAVDALNAHFPAVLTPVPATSSPRARGASHATPVFAKSTEPEHIALNLQIQSFIEHFRQIVPSAPSSPTSSIGSLNGSSSAPLDAALNVLAAINTAASKLPSYPRSVYLQEFRDVGGLLAYTNPENSELAGFLDQKRRVALAAQVNAAILHSEGRATQSYLEQIARRTSAIYETITEKDIDPQPVWAGTDLKGAGAAYRISEQLKRRPFQKGGFNLHEYVWEMA